MSLLALLTNLKNYLPAGFPCSLRQALVTACCCLAMGSSVLAIDFSQSTGDLLYEDNSGNTLPYRLFLPADYNPEEHYPLVIFFYGAGERGTNNTSPSTGGGHMENLYQATQGALGAQYKALLLVPQCPSSDQWVNRPWVNGSYTNAQEPPEGQSMRSALAILDHVIASYPVETDRLYVTGLSMGGFGTWNAIRLRPNQFAAAMPLSGGGNVDQGALLKDIPIWAYHGYTDTVVPVSGTDDMRDAIQAADGNIDYTRINTGHSGWGTFYDNITYTNAASQSVYEWLFSQALAAPDPSTVVSSLNAVEADGVSAATITVTLKGIDNNPLLGKAVTLSSSRGAADTISVASGPSDASGIVTFTVSSSMSGIAEFTATNTTDSVVLDAIASVAFTGPMSPTLSTILASPETQIADGVSVSTITVNLKDTSSTPLPGKTVTLTSSRGASDIISAASGFSDANGIVTFTVKSNTIGVANFIANNATDNVAITSPTAVTFTSVPTIVVTQQHRSSLGLFTTVPNPSHTDYADTNSGNGVSLDIPANSGVGHSGVGGSASRSRLLDGLSVTSLGNLSQVFAFTDPGSGRLKMDLQANIPIAEINTFSTHEANERIAQKYSVYGSATDLPGSGNISNEGWTLIASVAED